MMLMFGGLSLRPLAKTCAKSAGFPSGGAVAQLGERLVRNEEVRGSTPLGSTKSPVATGKKSCAKGFACVGRRIFSPNLAMLCS